MIKSLQEKNRTKDKDLIGILGELSDNPIQIKWDLSEKGKIIGLGDINDKDKFIIEYFDVGKVCEASILPQDMDVKYLYKHLYEDKHKKCLKHIIDGKALSPPAIYKYHCSVDNVDTINFADGWHRTRVARFLKLGCIPFFVNKDHLEFVKDKIAKVVNI